jgi:hypothetical protein
VKEQVTLLVLLLPLLQWVLVRKMISQHAYGGILVLLQTSNQV